MGDRVRHDVAQGAGEVAGIRPGDDPRRDDQDKADGAVPADAVERLSDLRDRRRDVHVGGPRLQRRRLRAGEIVDVAHDATKRGGRGPRGLEAREIGRDDAVDHRLELRLEDRGRRRQVVGDVAGGPPPEHLGAFQAVRHGVERLGQFGRFEVVAPGGAGGGIAGLEPTCRGRHVVERAGEAGGDGRRDEHDPEHAHEPCHDQRHVEEREEAPVRTVAREIGLQGGHDRPVHGDRRGVVGDVARRRLPEGRQRRPVGRDHANLAAKAGRQAQGDRLDAGIGDLAADPVAQQGRRVVEAALLLVRDDGLVPVAHDPVDDDTDEQEHRDHGDPEQQAESPGK